MGESPLHEVRNKPKRVTIQSNFPLKCSDKIEQDFREVREPLQERLFARDKISEAQESKTAGKEMEGSCGRRDGGRVSSSSENVKVEDHMRELSCRSTED